MRLPIRSRPPRRAPLLAAVAVLLASVPAAAGAHFLEVERDAIIRHVREHELERPILVGHSLGALLAVRIATSGPGLVGAVGALPADRRDGTRRMYEAQVARVPDHRVVTADARHFLMLDDPDFLLATMDEFLAGRATGDATRARGAKASVKRGATEGGR